MTTSIIYILYLVGVIISWYILYHVVKAAVRNGIKEARIHNDTSTNIKYSKPEVAANSEQKILQQRYDKGEIPFEVYQSEWNKLKS